MSDLLCWRSYRLTAEHCMGGGETFRDTDTGFADDDACEPLPEPPMLNVLSVDAWRDDCGWQWNAWHRTGTLLPLSACRLTPRKLLRLLRSEGLLSDASKGRMRVTDDQYNVVIENRHTGEPIFALPYGEHES